MQLNLFSWIREGVRQSVLLGVSDAVEALGEPTHDPHFHQNLGKLIEQAPAEERAPLADGKRKRLGRSLKDFDGATS
ncbi:hypothetical protein [Anatilimnocola floriformis]|uniref:hypothetical protein n=1 Tax=Anatilimnocola floriformis TaxID=2948575 RepID=UPI0020C543F8|nr:hypothetical protein [Anatilimnocola floriformis]